MTRQKTFKTRVRDRASRTGESYTTARRRLLEKSTPVRPQSVPDGAVRERTGRGWDEWFALLDTWGATGRTHTEIARWLRDEHGVESWWSQNVTVTYEQARGTRVPGQGADGYFSATGSKTVAVSVDRLFEAFADEDLRSRWLPGVELSVTTSTAPKSFRAGWEDGATRIAAGFVAKGEAKAQLAVRHERIGNAEDAALMKAFWRERLSALKELLET